MTITIIVNIIIIDTNNIINITIIIIITIVNTIKIIIFLGEVGERWLQLVHMEN